jgi:hypothetical protein
MLIEEEWIYRRRGELQCRYGAGTFVAVYDWAVIDWGDDPDAVRQRAEETIGDRVFVGSVPADRPDDITEIADWKAHMEAYRAYRARFEGAGDKRRYRLTTSGPEAFYAIAELDITGQKTEFVDGVIIIDGVEKRYADHDYRLMVEHGIVPKDTELIAGVVFWKKPSTGRPTLEELCAQITDEQRDGNREL